jgi:PadR family transcriptional regulator
MATKADGSAPFLCSSLVAGDVPDAVTPFLTLRGAATYISLIYMSTDLLAKEVKKGTAELLILTLLEDAPRHGYDIGRQIDVQSEGAIRFQIASLYPMLYRMEKRGLIEGRWVERARQRRRRFYRLTPEGRRVLRAQRSFWNEFITTLNRVARLRHA